MVKWSHRPGVPYYPPRKENNPMTDVQIKHMVNRFLMWRLPENFHPDNGISFKPTFNDDPRTWKVLGITEPMKCSPVGTNLFDATQAEEMVRHMIEGMPEVQP